jgi:signal transduction histidine kinase
VLSLAALLAVVISFTALAVVWLLRTTLVQERRELVTAATELVVAGVVDRVRLGSSRPEIERFVGATVGRWGLLAMAWYDAEGRPVVQRATTGGGSVLHGIDPRRPRPFRTIRPGSSGSAGQLVWIEPIGQGQGSVVAVVTLGVTHAAVWRFARPVLLYLGTSGILLLIFGYVALTSLIVRPLDGLTRATEEVSRGRLDVSVPLEGGRELARAAEAFNRMTARIHDQRETLHKQLRELEEAAEEVRSIQEQLVRSAKLASVGSLAAGVAHEVGNPVSAILGLSEVLLEGDNDPEEERDYMERIRREAERVSGIIRDLLEYARPGSPTDQQGPASVEEALEYTLGLLRPQKTFRQIEVRQLVAEVAPVDLGQDPLSQVLLNLLLNAAEAIAGEGTIEVQVQSAYLPAVPGRRLHRIPAVEVRIADSGPGAQDENLPHLFEPFFTTKEPGAGTGLGLAMCEGIVERAGGSLTAANRPAGGFVVILTLPAVV